MGDLVDLERWRRDLAGDPEPDPARRGWVVVERGPDDRPVRWFHPHLVAQIGQVPSDPGWVFLDHDERIRAWSTLRVGDLSEGLASGQLPRAEVTLRWDGTVVDHA